MTDSIQQRTAYSDRTQPRSVHPQAANRAKSEPLNVSQTPTKLQHIMIVSDAIEPAETLQIELSQKGYQVSVIHDGLRGLLAINRMKPDMVITSWSPPRLTGVQLCERLRANKREGAILLLTQNDSPEERIAGFNAGADDCLSLPLNREELFARIQANLTVWERHKIDDPLLRLGDILLNRETREVFRSDRCIPLTAKEFNLLEYFMKHPFQVLTRAQILEHVWGYDYAGSSNIIEVYIRYLRKKLGATADNRVIHTVRSVGYILKDET